MSVEHGVRVHRHTPVQHPGWMRDAVLYQLNTRQFTPEGTFAAAQAHLPRLAALGVDVLWLMPVHPIGEHRRKGSLGSPYAVKDYYGVNPELGDHASLRAFVDAAHALGLHVILDWVPNHTAWDNPLTVEHPDWYRRDWKGDFCPTPWWDWDDIIDLDYSSDGLRRYMIDAMTWWVRELDVDGFRCDVAGYVPTDFWREVRASLEAVKPVLLLAEWEGRDMHDGAFDMTYSWSWNDAMHRIAMGKADVGALQAYYAQNERGFPDEGLRMLFVSNHDKNAWEGTEFEQFGDALEAAIALSVVGEGVPLIYNGQEAGSDKRLAFFDKDVIDWAEHPLGEHYRWLLALKKRLSPLWNAPWGARMIRVPTSDEQRVLSFVRQDAAARVLAVFNLSPDRVSVTFGVGPHHGAWTDVRTGALEMMEEPTSLDLGPWEFRILEG
ncbi:MAG: alpha-amylase family glycosyl hydrolase [Candidatus Nanopelagicales bacterium]